MCVHFSRVCSANVNEGAVRILTFNSRASGCPSPSYCFVSSQEDNLFDLDPHHTRATIPLRPPTQTIDRECELGILITQATPERGYVSPPGHHRSPASPASSRMGSLLFHIFISNFIATPIKTIVDKHFLLGRRPRSLELCWRERWRVRIIGRGKRRRLRSNPTFFISLPNLRTARCTYFLCSGLVYVRLAT
ncbi:hypothetical protein EI94DRAFT_868817 [Lactarius quietus]|nr:hypothetical protein EI94DRAFT_868817 [Lactarius quietus]